MKKIIGLLSLLVFLSFNNTSEVTAQLIVKAKPARPAVVLTRPVKVRTGYTWIDGHWHYNRFTNRYVWKKGHWQKTRRGQNYVAGNWVTCNGGYKWVPGRWSPVKVVVNPKPVRTTVVVKKRRVTPRGNRRR
ncbi:MAG: hypothetical protein MK207_08130 [Saprospiraceae bacterium]|nr:hypothetical protein [Saprospiraceae bacterium]